MSIDRRRFIRSAGLAAAAVSAGRAVGGQAQPPRRPNILYIMTDQQPTSCVGAYGNTIIRTPNLDELARRGCVFENLYIAAFPCSPSRACQLTGRYAHNHGVLTNDVLLDPKVPCLGDLCKAAGYDTGHFGKWHLGGHMYRGVKTGHGRWNRGNWCMERTRDKNTFRFKVAPGGNGEDTSQHGFDSWAGGWTHYRTYLGQVGLGGMLKRFPRLGNHTVAPSGTEDMHIYSRVPEEHHTASFLAKQAESFVRGRATGGRPWCAVLSFYGPHLPVAPPKPWDAMYSLDQVDLPANHADSLAGKPAGQRNAKREYVLPKWSDDQFKDYIRRYWGYCSYIDKQIGRVFGALHETNQWDNTIVVFTSDHGDMVGAHGMAFKLGTCGYEELYRVPAIAYLPGTTKPGSRNDALTSSVDLLPTLLEAARIAPPAQIDGKSLLPLFRDGMTKHREAVFCDCQNSSFICRDKRYKFALHWNPTDLAELYDLQADPGEMKNLAGDLKYNATVEAMKQRILDWTRRTGHPHAAAIAKKVTTPARG